MCSGAQILDLQNVSYLGEVVLGISLNSSFMSKKYAFECIRVILFMQFISKELRLYVEGGNKKKSKLEMQRLGFQQPHLCAILQVLHIL